MNIVKEFEELLESYYPGTKAIAVNSGTSALIACLKSLGLAQTDDDWDEVITSPFTFQATADAIVLADGIPVFADINPETRLITYDTIRKVHSHFTKAIVSVNLFGRVTEARIAMKYRELKIPVIEDSAQCFLNPCNNITYSDAQCFSFYRTKNLQAGEGGAIVVREHGLLDYEKIWSICNNGRLPNKPKYEHYNIGYNFRMSEYTALILYNQLKYHPEGIRAELGKYDENDGYYPALAYQQPSFKKLGITGNCPVAEKIVKEIAEKQKKA